MASLNYASREMSVKIIYYGPGLSGKTTNLKVIHQKTPPERRSRMTSLATQSEQTIFFDFLPLDLGKIRGFTVKLHLYSVPGQSYYNATRKLVLRGVDGIVFVADSAPDMLEENIESFRNLEENLFDYKYKQEEIPTVIQYNKRDLPNALSIDTLDQQLNRYHLPWTKAVANKSQGVFDTLRLVSGLTVDQLEKKLIMQYTVYQAARTKPVAQSWNS
jgi:mutual gliding-motility protein MglA